MTQPVAPGDGAQDDPTGWFDPIYAQAEGDPGKVPWADERPHGHVLAWLDQVDLEGVDAVVVGCGLGDDAAELARRGAKVTAFDVSPQAIDWARSRFEDLDVDWQVGDVLDLPEHWKGAFGLVVEVRTVQSLPVAFRVAAMHGVASLVGPGGYLLAVLHLATSAEAQARFGGPPWPLAPSELAEWGVCGLTRMELAHPPHVPAHAEVTDVRTVWQRPA